MPTIVSDKKGFTLVEVIIVMLILSVVMMAVMSLFIPVKRSSVVQSQVSDVQGGMRVALDSMAKDFRNAGFLVNDDPATAADDLISVSNPLPAPDDDKFRTIAIRSRAGAVGIVSPAGIPDVATGNFVLSDADQGKFFPVGTFVGVFTPMTRDSYVGGVACKVVAQDATDKSLIQLKEQDGVTNIDISTFKADGQTALILVPLENGAVTAANTVRTVTYTASSETINGKTVNFLQRTVAVGEPPVPLGTPQRLARGVDIKFTALQTEMADGTSMVNRVKVEMTGETVELSKDAIGSAKTRSLNTVFNLRNI